MYSTLQNDCGLTTAAIFLCLISEADHPVSLRLPAPTKYLLLQTVPKPTTAARQRTSYQRRSYTAALPTKAVQPTPTVLSHTRTFQPGCRRRCCPSTALTTPTRPTTTVDHPTPILLSPPTTTPGLDLGTLRPPSNLRRPPLHLANLYCLTPA